MPTRVFHPSGVGKWVPASAVKAKAGMVHSVSGCAGKTVRSLENACHTCAPQMCVHDKALYKYTFTCTLPYRQQQMTCQSSSQAQPPVNNSALQATNFTPSISLLLLFNIYFLLKSYAKCMIDRDIAESVDKNRKKQQKGRPAFPS